MKIYTRIVIDTASSAVEQADFYEYDGPVAQCGGGKGSAPAAPDYAGAAAQQGESSKEVTNMQTWANRPNLSTPWGSQSWSAAPTIDPSTGQPVTQWSSNISLSPDQQASLDAQQDITQGRSEAAKTLLGQATGAFQEPFDWSSMPDVPGSVSDAQGNAYKTMSAALEPGRTRAVASLDTKLANQGLARGTEAFKRAQQDLSDQFTQQDKSLLAQSMGEGRADVGTQQQLRQAAIAEQAQKRGLTLNELNALLTGQQVSMPQMPTFTNASAAQPLQALSAAQMQGDYGLGAAKLNQSAGPDIGSLVGSGMTAAAMAGMF